MHIISTDENSYFADVYIISNLCLMAILSELFN